MAEKDILSPADKEYYHNKGQEDAAQGTWNSPAGGINSIFTRDIDIARAEAYKEGWVHTQSQKGE